MRSDLRLGQARTPSGSDLHRARHEIAWVPDEDLAEVERREPLAAWALSLFFGGGGQLYLRDYVKGVGLTAFVLLSLFALPTWLGWMPWVATGVVSSLFAFRKARAVNRYVFLRERAQRVPLPDAIPPAYRLLAAQATFDPGAAAQIARTTALAHPAPTPAPSAHQTVIDQLRRLAALHREGVLDDAEFKDRKQDTLTEIPIATRALLDDVLFEFLPLREEGVLEAEDLEFLKALGPRT